MRQIELEFKSRCRGAILGTAFGDALGLPVEGFSAEQISRQHGLITDYLPSAAGPGRYSDDTQLTVATAISLIRRGGLDAEDCARSCAELFDPERGYGRSAVAVLTALKRGQDYRVTGTRLFPEGSFGNGAAMRIAPVGLLYGHLPAEELRQLVVEAVLSTHVHNEAIDAAMLIAIFVGRFSRAHRSGHVNIEHLLSEISESCHDQTMREKIELALSLMADGVEIENAAIRIGCGVRSSESVVMALFIACRYLDDAETALVRAVHCGGDTDTIAAMVGAIVGARHGEQIFPSRWHAGLERGEAGYEALIEMSDALSELAFKKGFFVDFYQ